MHLYTHKIFTSIFKWYKQKSFAQKHNTLIVITLFAHNLKFAEDIIFL